MVGPVIGMSSLVLTTGELSKFEKCCEFYQKLGFEEVYVNNMHVEDVDEEDRFNAIEKWYNLFTSNDISGAPPIKITYRVSSRSLLQKASVASLSTGNKVGFETISFTVANFETIPKLLNEANTDFSYVPDEVKPCEIVTTDPLDNRISFSLKENIFSRYPEPRRLESIQDMFEPFNPYKSEKRNGRIAMLTSGGDAPGMNAAVRAVVRMAIYKGFEVFTIHEGYQGLISGGNMIQKMDWEDVREWLMEGGTLIGSARSKDFRTREGRLKAAQNLVENGIDYLIICGGDGSLTGADIFRKEYTNLMKELCASGRIGANHVERELQIVGLVGSIDNDMCLTDVTIGAYTSLHRICEAVDSITSTASSHSRAFVIEVMGRNCGWLAITAALATDADYVFIPESPPASDWPDHLCSTVKAQRSLGKRNITVIVAEGAIDDNLNPINSSHVRDVLAEKLGLDSRVTTLGHIQRGGVPCAFDRMLATLQGVEAVNLITKLENDQPSMMVTMNENKISAKPLVEAVALTTKVKGLVEEKKFDQAMALRDPEFLDCFKVFHEISTIKADVKVDKNRSMRVALIHVGAPAGGINAASVGTVRTLLNRGHKVFAIYNGFSGLTRHEAVHELTWESTFGWIVRGGSEIGINRALPTMNMGMTAYLFQKYKFDALLIIGGFEAFRSLGELEKARKNYPALRIPMLCLPATVSNNVPGTEFSLGCDTCLNALANYCDAIKQSASASRRRLFVCETQGGNCGFITTVGGLIIGAMSIFTPEEGIDLNTLKENIEHLRYSFSRDHGKSRGGKVWLRGEKSSATFTTDILAKITSEEAGGLFDSRTAGESDK